MEITFLGAAGTVTGSKYLVRTERGMLMVDCGLFQGLKQLRLRNREPFPVDPAGIAAVVLTHAHLDHSGWLPVLVREGFRGPVFCSPATADLTAVLLRDSAHLQEEEADFANRHGYSKHHPALPLYGKLDAERAIELLRPVPMNVETDAGAGASFRFVPAGHIPGAASVWLRADGATLAFSGDLGRAGDPTLPPPEADGPADWLVVESTYGDRLHAAIDPQDELAEVVQRTASRGGVVLIPAFAVGRAHAVLYHLYRLRQAGRIPDIPVYLDSPMAAEAMHILARHPESLRLSTAEARAVSESARIVASVEESKRVDWMSMPRIVISASGMATGGRVLHHLKVFAPEPANTVLFSGYQAVGTRGAQMVAGAREIKIHGGYVPVRAEVRMMDSLSAHADWREILAWLSAFPAPPRHTFITHGEPAAADHLRLKIEEQLGWKCSVPEHRQHVVLAPIREPVASLEPAVAGR
ncbi:MAG TPA: MBL fold metallo-hydrolase [Longimicrobium sp.]